MKDVGKIILAIIVIVVVWKIVKGLIGLLVGLAVAGLVVRSGVYSSQPVVKVIEAPARIGAADRCPDQYCGWRCPGLPQ